MFKVLVFSFLIFSYLPAFANLWEVTLPAETPVLDTEHTTDPEHPVYKDVRDWKLAFTGQAIVLTGLEGGNHAGQEIRIPLDPNKRVQHVNRGTTEFFGEGFRFLIHSHKGSAEFHWQGRRYFFDIDSNHKKTSGRQLKSNPYGRENCSRDLNDLKE